MAASVQQGTAGPHACNQTAAMIECKFDELAKKILDELKQVHYSRDFFQAIDVILKEPLDSKQRFHPKQQQQTGGLSRSSSKSKIQQQPSISAAKEQEEQEQTKRERQEEKQLLKALLDKQKAQQEQLDNHQQILFDAQYKSLPANDKQAHSSGKMNKLTTSKTTSNLDKAHKQAAAQQQQSPSSSALAATTITSTTKSAIPQSTALSSCARTNITTNSSASAKQQAYALNRSATIGGSSSLSESSRRRPEPAVNVQQQQQSAATVVENHLATGSGPIGLLTASAKLKQRRPTRAILGDSFDDHGGEDDNDDEDDSVSSSDDDEVIDGYDEAGRHFANVAARRACLNERFLSTNCTGASQAKARQELAKANKTTTSEVKVAPTRLEPQLAATRQQQQQQQHRRVNSVQRSSTICGSNAISLQRAKFDRVASEVGGGGHESNGRQADKQKLQYQTNHHDEPRSIGTVQLLVQPSAGGASDGPVTMSHLYKPHMNYSTSALGNHHRLSDDDEIIIIPTTRSPTVSPGLMNSRNCSPMDRRAAAADDANNDDDPSQMDELSERFSISRTKSFWEKLTSAKSSPKGEQLQQQQSARSPSDLSAIAGQQPALVGVRSANNSPTGTHHHHQQQQRQQIDASCMDNLTTTGQLNMQSNGNKLVGVHHHQQQQQSNGNSTRHQLDSSGGSGNSNYSCSSGSGDENASFQLQLKRQAQMNAKAASQTQSHSQQQQQQQQINANTKPVQRQQQQQKNRTNCPKTVAAISQQLQEMSRGDRFRQTR